MAALAALLLLILFAGAFWWIKDNRWAIAVALVLVQLIIWWCANDLDNGLPWNLNRPILIGSPDPLWLKILILILLYGPLAAAGWVIWKRRR